MSSKEILSSPPPQDLVRKVNGRLAVFELYHLTRKFGPPVGVSPDCYEDEVNYSIMITKTPRGEAPEEIRKTWQELILPDCRRLKRDTRMSGIVTGQPAEYNGIEGYFEAMTLDALKALVENGTESDYRAALWFLEQPRLQLTLCFCADEVMVLKQEGLPKNRSYRNPRSN
jgi:hypothetical protein